jgi:hypothetical protein
MDDIDNVGLLSPMIGAVECCKPGVGACCSRCSDRELNGAAEVGLLRASPLPLF